ncbi:AlkA N-terminal domain-containing protein [Arthrobacter sp. zg-Y1110]|uniref:DNA-3-methyladenine glycosylase 2 n=1 Tax=Arthrobacter sp. zg-Y1110 TaxID=2886932 RepID=UPI001D145BBE|nr:AlkA N-terminal domain-containing protein [Arthrobacter sp. zg-Y1110]MCC3289661.1 3-methyladenine DNA glycosylase 2 [Arthrobacter sp. zg-Y1110]UWX84917.1 3-methyladenine DNA glycosylase 2 [Arthrobacter sp. zg-Y1110]
MTEAAALAGRQRRPLRHRGPFAWEPLASALQAHAVPGLERVTRTEDGATVERLLAGASAPLAVAVSLGDAGVVLDLPALPAAEEAALITTVRTWLDLDADPGVVDPFLSRFELLEPLVNRHPGLRVPGSADGFETGVQTVLGQQVSLAAARTFGARLVAAFGDPGPNGLFAFPTAERLAAVPAAEIQSAVRITHARARTLSALAEAVAGGLPLRPGAEPAAVRTGLLALPGIGPWTADYLAVRVLGDRDAYPADDLVLKRALGVGSGREAALLSQPWRPWRSYALFHLWTRAAYAVPAPAAR